MLCVFSFSFFLFLLLCVLCYLLPSWRNKVYILNWQLACQFSSANHLSYRIVSGRRQRRVDYRQTEIFRRRSRLRRRRQLGSVVANFRDWTDETRATDADRPCTGAEVIVTQLHWMLMIDVGRLSTPGSIRDWPVSRSTTSQAQTPLFRLVVDLTYDLLRISLQLVAQHAVQQIHDKSKQVECGPNSTTSIRCGFVQHLDMWICCRPLSWYGLVAYNLL